MAIDDPLTIYESRGASPDTRILTLTGPLTLRNLFDLQSRLRSGPPPKLSILDLTDVLYMDSAGMGLVINHYVQCQNAGCRMVVVGVTTRVHELFKMTRVDSIIPQASSLEAAEAS